MKIFSKKSSFFLSIICICKLFRFYLRVNCKLLTNKLSFFRVIILYIV